MTVYSIDAKIPLTLILSHKGERKSFPPLPVLSEIEGMGGIKGGWHIFMLSCEPLFHVMTISHRLKVMR